MIETGSRPLKVIRVCDKEGLPIGPVIQPKAAPEVGRGARTVLLVRSELDGGKQLLAN